MPRVKVSNVVVVGEDYGLTYMDIIVKPGLYQVGKPHGAECQCPGPADTYILVTEINAYVGMPAVLSVYPGDTAKGGPLGVVKPGSRWMGFHFRPVHAEVTLTFDGHVVTEEEEKAFAEKIGAPEVDALFEKLMGAPGLKSKKESEPEQHN